MREEKRNRQDCICVRLRGSEERGEERKEERLGKKRERGGVSD